jgi:hypothetical protein
MPPGGAISTQVAQTLGFFRDGRNPSGPMTRPPSPEKGAPQNPQRGVLGSARKIRLNICELGCAPDRQ